MTVIKGNNFKLYSKPINFTVFCFPLRNKALDKVSAAQKGKAYMVSIIHLVLLILISF